jgi:superfamily II DNA or RNA helicase
MTTGTPAFRLWQGQAREKVRLAWEANTSAKVMIAACPGAGKTFFAAMLIRELLQEGKIKLAIILAPTVNIQLLWVDEFNKLVIKATERASNFSLRWRIEEGVSPIEDNKVLVLTYAQLAQDSELIAEVARRSGPTLLGGDEIHHADDDEKYGEAVQKVADACVRTLALSGTPFNSTGGALALCDHELDVDGETGKPIRRTITTDIYSYGAAISDRVCRSVEFIKVYGRGKATYRLLSNGDTFKQIIDLAKARRGDRLSILLDPSGEFMEECALQTVRALAALRVAGDKKAGALVVAKNKAHGAEMAELLKRICEAENEPFLVQEIYNDTPKAHQRIDDLNKDTTDIIVSVRMISEGVDVKRLRVGLFATDWLTRMFFIQFIGRFVRYEDRLDEAQFSWVIIPAHIVLLEYAREIEKMIEAAAIPGEGNGGGGGDKKVDLIETSSEAAHKGVVHRGEDAENLQLAEAFFRAMPSLRGLVTIRNAIKGAEELGLDGASPEKAREKKVDWGYKNDLMVRNIVKRLKANGQSDEKIYEMVQARANRAVGISKKDKMTAEETLIKRHEYLHQWLRRIILGQEDDDA